jgi:hypothetical protein
MHGLLTGYAVSFNLCQRRYEHLFRNRFKSLLVGGGFLRSSGSWEALKAMSKALILLKGDERFFLDKHLREDIISGKRKRKLKNITIKVDPLQVKAIKKLSTMESIPCQTLIRSWLAQGIKSEIDSVLK